MIVEEKNGDYLRNGTIYYYAFVKTSNKSAINSKDTK
jgi:hypothetical protein